MAKNSPISPLMPDQERENHGALTSVAIIIILLIAGSIFMVNARNSQPEAQMASVPSATSTSTAEETTSTSTSLVDIDKDLENLEASLTDEELDQLEKEILGL